MSIPESDCTRASLLSRAKSRDSAAWRDLVDLYGPLIAHWCRRCGLDYQQAADAVQEVFLSVSASLANFEATRQSGAFRAWLWTITRNKVRDLYRRNRLSPAASGGSTALVQLNQVIGFDNVSPQEPTDEISLNQLVARGLAQVQAEFEPRTWSIFERSVVDQIATDMVAAEFQITAAAVRQARSRVLRRLRQQLGDLEQ